MELIEGAWNHVFMLSFLIFCGYIAMFTMEFFLRVFHQEASKGDELPCISPLSSEAATSDSGDDNDEDVRNNQEGRMKHVCRCKCCLYAARKRTRRL